MTTVIKRSLLILLGLGYLVILLASLYQRFSHPSLTVSHFPSAPEPQPAAMAGIGDLMQAVAANPNDKQAILKLTQSLIAIGQWESAENFAQKALSLDKPDNPDPVAAYLLAVIHHNQGRNNEAAELLEKILTKGDNPQARYNLGILYIHFLDQPTRGIEHLEKGIQNSEAAPSLIKAMREELARARLKQPPASPEKQDAQKAPQNTEQNNGSP